MSNALHQMTMSYSPTEDRLLLRVSTTAHDEHQIWLTRRFIKVLWPVSIKGVEKQSLPPETVAAPTTTPQVKRAVMAMQHNNALQKTDMTQKHDEEKVNKPSTDKPMLATGGQCVPLNTGGMRLNLKTAENLQVGLNLNEQLLHAFCHQVSSLRRKPNGTLHTPSATPMCKRRSVNRRCIKSAVPLTERLRKTVRDPTVHATFQIIKPAAPNERYDRSDSDP